MERFHLSDAHPSLWSLANALWSQANTDRKSVHVSLPISFSVVGTARASSGEDERENVTKKDMFHSHFRVSFKAHWSHVLRVLLQVGRRFENNPQATFSFL
jgi:hypothetical protein